MSSILKALKRLEEEKASRDGGQVDISRDILLGDSSAPAKGGWAGLWIAALVLLTVAVVGGFLVWINLDRDNDDSAIRDARPSQQQRTEVSEVALKPELEVKTTQVEKKSTPVQQPVRQPAAVEKSSLVKDLEPKTMASAETKNISADAKPVSAMSLESPLIVSGIVYQENNADRLAVVNDLPVMQGTVIDGYTVAEIERDRVWFTRGDVRVAVRLEE
ncbi:MAG: hypothetical protein C0616_06580 [Desulfuromonas sp.]|nr:MAG: hypothetical protein C0616_06580 [Desulfuromonas sp.]